MRIIDKIRHWFKRESTSENDGGSAVRRGAVSLLSGFGTEALSVAAVYSCVQFLCDSVANLPMRYMRRQGRVFVEQIDSRLHYLLTVQPNAHTNAFDFWSGVVRALLLEGNAYIVPLRNAASLDIDALYLCSAGTVFHDTMNDKYTVCDAHNGVYGTYDENEIIHVKGMPGIDPKVGLSVLSYARQTIDIAGVGERETLDRFENGGTVRGFLRNDMSVRGFGEYQDKQMRALASDIDSRFRSGERIVALTGQTEWHPVTLSAADMQFLESRKFTVLDICRFFRVHPSFIFADAGSNYKSAEMANVAFLSNTLNPLLRRIETELLCKLVAPSLVGRYKFEFNRRGIYACDLDSRVKYQTQTIAAGIYTVNEWRAEENKEPVAGGDRVLVSANLKDINALSDEAANSATENSTVSN